MHGDVVFVFGEPRALHVIGVERFIADESAPNRVSVANRPQRPILAGQNIRPASALND